MVHSPGGLSPFPRTGGCLAAAAILARSRERMRRPRACRSRRPQTRRRRILATTAVADVAVMLPPLSVELPLEQALHLPYAPVWLFTALTDSGFGPPHPTGMETFIIGLQPRNRAFP
jgi:hypothetical protein